MRRLALAVRGGWEDPGLLHERLTADQRGLLAAYEAAVRDAAADWSAAPVSPSIRRHGAALAVIFHWNRSAMPAHHQGLLATALVDYAASAASRVAT